MGSNTRILPLLGGSGGSQGVQGIQGIQGPQGQGSGDPGMQGIAGMQGAMGLQGLSGSDGHDGSNGVQGIAGLQGAVGLQGANGLQGDMGTAGMQGAVGLQGITGQTGTGVQGIAGLQGTTGLQGLQGPAGGGGGGDVPYGVNPVVELTELTPDYGEPITGLQLIQYIENEAEGCTDLSCYPFTFKISGQLVGGSLGIIEDENDGTVTGYKFQSFSSQYSTTQGEYVTNNVYVVFDTNGELVDQDMEDYRTYTKSSVDNMLQNVSGVQGIAGMQGANGLQGITGQTGTGVQGIAGLQGTVGLQGSNGLQGIQGPAGGGGGDIPSGLKQFVELMNISPDEGEPITGLQLVQLIENDGDYCLDLSCMPYIFTIFGRVVGRGIDEVYEDETLIGYKFNTFSTQYSSSEGEYTIGDSYMVLSTDGEIIDSDGTDYRTYTKSAIDTMFQNVSGVQGATGMQGAVGLQGTTGLQGITGQSGTGVQGIAGLQGTTGLQGSNGLQGIQGPVPSNTTVELQFVLADNSMVNYELYIKQ